MALRTTQQSTYDRFIHKIKQAKKKTLKKTIQSFHIILMQLSIVYLILKCILK